MIVVIEWNKSYWIQQCFLKIVSNWRIIFFWNELWFHCLKYIFWIIFSKNVIHCYCLNKYIISSWNISSFKREIPFLSFVFDCWMFFISYFFSFCLYYRSFSIIFTYRFHFLFLIILILFEWWNNQMKQWWYDWNWNDYFYFKLKTFLYWFLRSINNTISPEKFWKLYTWHFRDRDFWLIFMDFS